jgi:hypothetical protein
MKGCQEIRKENKEEREEEKNHTVLKAAIE